MKKIYVITLLLISSYHHYINLNQQVYSYYFFNMHKLNMKGIAYHFFDFDIDHNLGLDIMGLCICLCNQFDLNYCIYLVIGYSEEMKLTLMVLQPLVSKMEKMIRLNYLGLVHSISSLC